ncbi:MAG: hypothetical protein GXX99_03380 [Clostridiales bacterium]|nr:hypothetical protein [Clostridiales bacterium]
MKRPGGRRLRLLAGALLYILALSVCAADGGPAVCVNASAADGLGNALLRLLPGVELRAQERVLLDDLHGGAAVEAYDAQAQGALESGLAQTWHPLTLETVVIAVDRRRTDAAITSWADLQDAQAAVFLRDDAPLGQLLVAALCYGLEGEDFTLEAAMLYLEGLYRKGLLTFSEAEAPIWICFDSQAAARIRSGEDIEVVIPAEGTLSYARGLLSNAPLDLPGDAGAALLESGLRLPDGRCDAALYPAPDRYAPAKTLENYDHLNTALQALDRQLRREVLRTRLYTSADGLEHVMFAALFEAVAVIWVASILRRSLHPGVRRAVFAAGLLIAAWLLFRVLKYQLIGSWVLTRYIWYGFYLAEAGLLLAMLRIASLTGSGPEPRPAPRWFLGACALNAALVALVLTNDLHGLMFVLDRSAPDGTGNYGYGPLYFVVMACFLLELLASVGILFRKTKDSPRRHAVVVPLALIAALAAYSAGYAARIPVFFESDMTMVACVFALLFLECCMFAGQMPANRHYRRLFQNARMKLRITDEEGRPMLASGDADPSGETGGADPSPFPADGGGLLLKSAIAGGYAEWRPDITAIQRLKAEIEASNLRLAAGGEFLSRLAQVREQAAQTNALIKINAAFEADIALHQQRLDQMLRAMQSEEGRRGASIGIAALLICYIKRRCNLLFLEMGGSTTLPAGEAAAYLDELTEIARLAGVECLTACRLSREIGLRDATLFYDFFGSVLEWAAVHQCKKIILGTECDQNRTVMKLLLGRRGLDYALSERVSDEVCAAGGQFEKEDLEDMAGLRLSLPKGGVRDA